MIRRITAVFLSLAALLVLSGCTPQLTPEEYREKLMSCTSEYSAAQMEVVNSLTADDDGYFIGNLAVFEEKCKAFESAMKQIEEINPPDAYREKHRQAVKALDNEREWLEAVRSYTQAKTPEELKRCDDEIQRTANYENSFPMQVIQIIRSIG
ncbi:MAG: hypothetical protein J1F28_09070 [Oscillospiraceae bacterium]|nr:hypothetical protein [Oscillospiraceae bacterium]